LTINIYPQPYIGDIVTITVADIKGYQVRMGINAPKDLIVNREEIQQRVELGEANGDGQ